MAKLTLQCRTGRTDERGYAPVRIRISHRGKRRFVSTDVHVLPGKWKPETGQVKRSHPQASEVNAALRRTLSDAQEALTSVETSRDPVTASRVRDAVTEAIRKEDASDRAPTFLEYARERLQHYDNQSTRQNHAAGLSKLQRFLEDTRGQPDVRMHNLTASLLEEMIAWEKSELGNKPNTVHKTMRTIRRMTNAAIRDDHLSREDYPFEDLTLERQRTEKTSLRPDQVRSLEAQLQAAECGDAYPERDTLAMHALRGFLFQIYMLGMRWGDLATLTWSSVGPERITYSMQKNGTTKDLKIVPKAAAILESYEDRRGERRFVFPFLDRYQDDPSYNLDQENDTSRAISSRLARVNPLLKTCAQKAGIEAKVTSHVARHSFAETAMRAGWSLQEISSALGHSSVATTEDYLRTLRDDELDDKHEELF